VTLPSAVRCRDLDAWECGGWQAQQVEDRVTQRYAPIEQQWKAQALHAQAAPRIKAMLDDARQWPGFADHEEAILAALRGDPKFRSKALT
jgi:hypothetical protein